MSEKANRSASAPACQCVDDIIGKRDSAFVTAYLDGAVKDRSVKSSDNFGQSNSCN
jgi:hypothetical protein